MTWIVSMALQFSPYAIHSTHSHLRQIDRALCRCRSSRSTPRRPRTSPAGCCSCCCCCCLGCSVSAGALWVDWLACAGEQLAAQVSRPSCRQLRQLRWRAPARLRRLWTTQQHLAAASESLVEGWGVELVLLDHFLKICHMLVTI